MKLPVKSVRKSSCDQSGFTLIECTIAMVITMIGVLAAAALIVVGVRLQVESRDATAATAAARSMVEILQNSSPTSATRAAGGGIATNVTGYNDVVDTRYRRRWQIENAGGGVPANTQRVTVVVVANVPGVLLPPVQITTLMPAS